MENQASNTILDITIDEDARQELIQLAKWAKLLSIMGVIFGIIIVFAGLVAMILGSAIDLFAGFRGIGPLAGIISVLFGLVYLYPSWRLLKYATLMPAALSTNDQASVNSAFRNMKSCFKFWGILALIILGFYALIFLIQLFAAVM